MDISELSQLSQSLGSKVYNLPDELEDFISDAYNVDGSFGVCNGKFYNLKLDGEDSSFEVYKSAKDLSGFVRGKELYVCDPPEEDNDEDGYTESCDLITSDGVENFVRNYFDDETNLED